MTHFIFPGLPNRERMKINQSKVLGIFNKVIGIEDLMFEYFTLYIYPDKKWPKDPKEVISSDRRYRHYADFRNCLFYYLTNECKFSLKKIIAYCQYLGRDSLHHTTIMNGTRSFDNLMFANSKVENYYNKIVLLKSQDNVSRKNNNSNTV